MNEKTKRILAVLDNQCSRSRRRRHAPSALTPHANPVASSCGDDFCLPCLRYAFNEKHRDGHQESRHEEDLDADNTDDVDEDSVEILVQKGLSETRLEQIKQLEDNFEQLKTTLVCALGLASLEDRAWVDEAIAKERLETRREIAWLERGTLGRL